MGSRYIGIKSNQKPHAQPATLLGISRKIESSINKMRIGHTLLVHQ